MASDPRSLHDSDYFLSRRFPRDIEEAEWLHGAVGVLREYLDELEQARPQRLAAVAERMRQDATIPPAAAWEDTRRFVQVLLEGLAPKLNEVLALRGVRFQEMEILDRYALEIPIRCRTLFALYETGSEAVAAIEEAAGDADAARLQSVRDARQAHAASSRRMAELLGALDATLRDLVAFAPLWLEGIEKRRALLLKKSNEE